LVQLADLNSFVPTGSKKEPIVVDAGYHPGGVGDIELAALAERAPAALTPVPGGVGPMTINTLIQQTVESGEKALARVKGVAKRLLTAAPDGAVGPIVQEHSLRLKRVAYLIRARKVTTCSRFESRS